MELDHQHCYRILLARDARYDGRFVVAVETTGIYCRPICPARPPKSSNCRFLPTAAAAQAAGFRACLRCRPECSPDTPASQGTAATVRRALSLIAMGGLDGGDVSGLAARVGMGERQLRRLFHRHLGASPVAVAQTRRVLLAKQLIHDSSLPLAEVAMASGFSSVRRFNEAFRQLYGRSPSALRGHRTPAGQGASPPPPAAPLRLLLHYRPPYDWSAMLRFLSARTLPGLERVVGGHYQRLIVAAGQVGALDVEHVPEARGLSVTLCLPELRALPAVIAQVRQMFDLAADPAEIAVVLERDAVLAPLLASSPGLRVPGAFDPYEVAIRAVLGQQVTVAAGSALAGRFLRRFGQPVGADTTARLVLAPASPTADGSAGGEFTHTFPQPKALAVDEVASLGLPRARALAVCALAAAVEKEPRLLQPQADLETAIARLQAIPGIGPWTAHYIAMRALRESDAFVVGDAVVARMLTEGASHRPATAGRLTAKEMSQRAQAFRPWRAYAVMHLWHRASLNSVQHEACADGRCAVVAEGATAEYAEERPTMAGG